MTQPKDKEREREQGKPSSMTPDSDAHRDTPKDPDLYDPVGMAGKEAGIVKEIEQELKASTKDEGSDEPGAKREGGKSRI
jgi:hypothetical protein